MKDKFATIKKIATSILYIYAYIAGIAFCARTIVNLTLAMNEYNKET